MCWVSSTQSCIIHCSCLISSLSPNSTFGAEVGVDFVTKLEERIHRQIAADIEGGEGKVTRETADLRQAISEHGADLVLLPGENYPEQVSIVTLPLGGKEPCCGTHLVRVGDLQSFAVVDLKSVGHGIKSLRCLTGSKAAAVRERGIQFIHEVQELNDAAAKLDESSPQEEVRPVIERLRKKAKWLRASSGSESGVPFAVSALLSQALEQLLQRALSLERRSSKQGMVEEFAEVLEEQKRMPFAAHLFDISKSTKVLLSRVTGKCRGKPVLVLAQSEGGVYGRATVPGEVATGEFNATSWLSIVGEPLGLKCSAPRGQDERLVCNFSSVVSKKDLSDGQGKANLEECRRRMPELLKEASEFAKLKLSSPSTDSSEIKS